MKSFIVDAFTNTAFKGNPAGVCLVERPLSDERMLHIAAELNLSETAFLQATGQPDSFSIRYFWPWAGTNEDPVTGGTHTFLAPYWAKKLGKRKMKSFQCSRRSGFMEVEIQGEALCIRSQAVIVFEGEIRV